MVSILHRLQVFEVGMKLLDPTKVRDMHQMLKDTKYHQNLLKKDRDMDFFDYATVCYIVRRSRRVFMGMNNMQ